MLHRGVMGGIVKCNVIDIHGKEQIRELQIRRLTGHEIPAIRYVDSVIESVQHAREMHTFRGVQFKSLRMDDVLQHQLQKYMMEENQHAYKLVVADMDSSSPAYASKTIRPGNVVATINDQPAPNTFQAFYQLMQNIQQQNKPVKFTFENNQVVIL